MTKEVSICVFHCRSSCWLALNKDLMDNVKIKLLLLGSELYSEGQFSLHLKRILKSKAPCSGLIRTDSALKEFAT